MIRLPTAGLVGLLVIAALSACAPPVPQSNTAGQGDSSAAAGSAARKMLTVGVQREPTDLGVLFGQGTATTAGGAGSVKLIPHDKLAVEMDLDTWKPQLAQALPSIDAGTWRVNADGSMDTTWKLRPNIKWHDGTPFTSDDLMFTFTAFMDPDLPSRYGEAIKAMQSASAPDPLTFEVHWTRPNAQANE